MSFERLEIIHAFLDKAKQLLARQPGLNAKGLVEYWQLLQDYSISVPFNRATPVDTGVKVGTVHSAKGLEFETVIMPRVGADSWRVRPNRSVIKLPSQIVDVKKWREDQLEDERRLFYVGLTRAKKELILTTSRLQDNGAETLPSQFVTEIADTLSQIELKPDRKTTTKVLTTLLNPPSSSLLKARQHSFVQEKISQSPFSYTHYRAYLTCPRQYLLRSILKLPEPPSFSLQYGSAVHKAFEHYFKRYSQTKVKPNQDQLTQGFAEAIKRELTGADLERTLKKGTDLLASYFEQKSASWLMPVGVEYSFYNHHVLLDDVWLTGKFDRVDPIDPVARTVRVVDYKTGSKPKTRGQIEGTTKDSDGETKRQLIFYALLAARDRLFPYIAREFVISSVDDAGKFTDEVFTVSADEITALEKEILATYREIQNRQDFLHTRAEFDRGCELCDAFPG